MPAKRREKTAKRPANCFDGSENETMSDSTIYHERKKVRWEQNAPVTTDASTNEEIDPDEEELTTEKEPDLLHEESPSDSASSEYGSISGNAYDFMRKRRDVSGDPTLKRWNALMASIGALLDHVVRERAVGDLDDEGIRGLDIRDIKILTL
ncbi:hypothetical protein C0989_003894 [Termitomyces sp. Mn162]|nr:hypothetical protein C0989_003894 [Termitomyces sp. Mn162]